MLKLRKSCCIAAALRFYFLYQSEQAQAGSKNYGTSSHAYLVCSCTMTKTYSLLPGDATRGYIWSHIEPNCSIVAACLPTYGNLFTGKHTIFSSLRSFFTLGSRYGSSNSKTRGGDNPSETSILGTANKSNNSRKAWQKLDRSIDNNIVEITAPAPAQRADIDGNEDLEAGMDSVRLVRIDITREFGSEVTMA